MIAKAASRLQQFFGRDRKKNEEPPRHTRTADSTTRTMRALCDVVVVNDGTLEEFDQKLEQLAVQLEEWFWE